MGVVYAFWKANQSRDSTLIRNLSTSDQPLRYGQMYWEIEGSFPDSTNVKLLDAYRAPDAGDTVFVEVDLLHMQCPVPTGGGAVHWRFLLLPLASWRIARLESEPC